MAAIYYFCIVFVDLFIRDVQYPEIPVGMGYSVRISIPAPCRVKARARVGSVGVVFVDFFIRDVHYPEIPVGMGYSVRISIPASCCVEARARVGSVGVVFVDLVI